MDKVKPRGIVCGTWWALVRGPKHPPCVFSHRQDAIDNMDYDEYVVRIKVGPASARHLAKKVTRR